MEGPSRMPDLLWPGRVTEVVDPHYFWMQLGTTEVLGCFMKLQSDIQHFCSQHWTFVTDSDMDGFAGQLVLVDTGQQEVRYKRGQVTRTSDDRVDIFFVDYGSTELTTLDKISVQFPPQFKRWPPQAVRCCLAGVQPPMEGHEVPEFVNDVTEFMANLSKNSDYETNDDEERPEPVSNGNQIPDSTESRPSTQKYIPPGKKFATSSSSASSGTSPGSSANKLSLNTTAAQSYGKPSSNTPLSSNNVKSSEPCPDFFPFENVSTYPPSPANASTSPTKSSSFSRTDSLGSGEGGMSHNSRDRDSHVERMNQLSESPVKCDFMPDFGDAVIRQNVSNNSYKENSTSNSLDLSGRHERSPMRPIDHVTTSPSARPVFYRPNIGDGNNSKETQNHHGSLVPPKYFQPPVGANQRFEVDSLTPPEFYRGHAVTEHISPSKSTQHEHSPKNDNYMNYETSSSNDSSAHYESPVKYNQSGRFDNSVRHHDPSNYTNTSKYSSSPNYDTGYFPPEPVIENQQSPRSRNQPYYQSTSGSPGSYPHGHRETFGSNRDNHDHLKDYKTNSSALKMKLVHHTPEKSVYPTKLSPMSPESPAYIAGFDIMDIDHTRHLSTHGLDQKMHQEKLSALQEEAEELKIESKEQSSLAALARYGAGSSYSGTGGYVPTPTIFDQITEEIKNTSHDISPNPSHSRDHPRKLDDIPSSYYSDIDFVCLVKDALESAESSDIDNTRQLLKEITEALKVARVEKQMYDILLLLIAKGVTDYNSFHPVILDCIDHMNSELTVSESLAKALKRQQELCVRIPLPKNGKNLEYSRLMGHIYNMSQNWTDGNSIHDGIQSTLEKWIVFNNKGSQIGQDEKEHLFLDCFVAFWEVAGAHLIKHNNDFRSQVQQEMKKKLLNEAVARSIRERLLDILLEFVVGASDQDTTDMYTQTPRRTMIPSSCQVKPAVRDKGTMARGDIDEQLENYDLSSPEGTRWYINAAESPVSNISLRPRAAPVNRGLRSTPQGDRYKPSSGTPDMSGESPSTSLFVDDLSNMTDASFATDTSVYMTPNESFASVKSPQVLDNETSTNDMNKSKNANMTPVSSRGSTYMRKEPSKTWASAVAAGKSDSVDKHETGKTVEPISASLSAKGRSVVDWFDYEPDSRSSSPNLPVPKKTKTGKAAEKLDSRRKKKMTTSMQLIASELVSPSKAKDSGQETASGDRKIDEARAKESGAQKVSGVNTNSDKSDKNDLGAVRDEGSKTESGKDVDWWGAESTGDQTCKPCQDQAAALGDYENGPEIIEADHAEEDVLMACDDPEVVDMDIAEQIAADAEYAEKLASMLAMEDAVVPAGMETSTGQGDHEGLVVDTATAMMREGIQRIDDEYSFDLNVGDSDSQWETDSENEDFHIPQQPTSATDTVETGAYDVNFPTSNLSEHIRTSESPIEITGSGNHGNNVSYNQEFPETNLADLVRNPEPQFQEPAPATAPRVWVPGVRRCTVCGDTDHTVYECPNRIHGLLY